MNALIPLPIDPALDSLAAKIATGSGRLVLESPPGSGKSTRLAPRLLKSFSGKIFLLQPRRSSTLLVARRIAEENGWTIGREVGYIMRLEKKIEPQTRLILATHGSFLQYLSHEPELAGVSTVIVDEFHERSLDIDLVSGLLRYSQEQLRPDLRLVWMSATGGAQRYAEILDSERVQLEGRGFPIEVLYKPVSKKSPDPIESSQVEALKVLRQIFEKDSRARVLVFLPGQREIAKFERSVKADAQLKTTSVLSLHGSLDLASQERVIQSATPAEIVLSTNLAETSLTLKDIRYVVDFGYEKLLSFDESSGREFLQLVNISADSATQRAGRSGRTAPGVCYRLWSEDQHRFRDPQQKPEVLRRNIEGAILRLLEFGFSDLAQFPWITPPKDSLVEKILRRFRQIQVLEGEAPRYQLTKIGRGSFRWPLETRWGILLERASNSGMDFFALAALLATLTDGAARPSVDGDVFQALRDRLGRPLENWPRTDRDLFQDLCRRAGITTRSLPTELSKSAESELRNLMMETFPDHLSKRRTKTALNGLLGSGRAIEWEASSGPAGDYFLALEVALKPFATDSKLLSWVDLSREDVERMLRTFGEEEVWLDETSDRHQFLRQRKIFGLGISEAQSMRPSREEELRILQKLFEKAWALDLDKNRSFAEIKRRMKLALPNGEIAPGPEFCLLYQEATGKGTLDLATLREFDFYSILPQILSHTQIHELDRLAPRAWKLKNGRSRPLEYLEDGGVDLSVMLQDLLGVNVHPVVGLQKKPIRIHLLSPAKRPIQVTSNLPGFWQTSYAQVRKELRGRYPKHRWPENPRLSDPSDSD